MAVAIVDVTGKADPNVTVLTPEHPADLARSYGASTPPTTLLIGADGGVLHRWSATVAHAQDIAPFLRDLSNPTPPTSK